MAKRKSITSKEAADLYRALYLARECEEKIRVEYFKNEMKTPVHLALGQEAIAVGVQHVLKKRTAKYFATYRNHAVFLSVTDDLESFFGELYGRANGCARGKAGSMHLSLPAKGLISTSAVVGTPIPVAVGSALVEQYRGTKGIAVVFFGDGAVEEGVFWESLNFACLRKLPILFVCEDNGLAIHTPKKDRQGFKSLKKVVEGFDCPFAEGDGTEVEDVVSKAASVVSLMKKNKGPGFLYFSYHRFLQHVGPLEDYDANYREKPTRREQTLDPVLKFKKRLPKLGVSEKKVELIESEVMARIQKAVEKAQQAPFPAADELFRDVYSGIKGSIYLKEDEFLRARQLKHDA